MIKLGRLSPYLKKTKPLDLKPKSVTEAIFYRDLANLHRLTTSKPGMFWCYTHLMDLSLSEQSSDPRYCNLCYGILMAEYRDTVSIRGKRKLWWAPATSSSYKTTTQVLEQGALIMSTLNDETIEVDKINLTSRDGRGRRPQPLPVERIKQLSLEGNGSKAIATRLQSEGFSISYKTVQRRLLEVVKP